QLKGAQSIQKEVGIATAAVGKITDPHFAEKILQENGATLIFIGRAFLNNPHWPYMAADVLANEKTFKYPNQYDWCIGWKAMSDSKKSLLFSPITIRGVTLKNRIVVSPMCQYSCEDGIVNDWHLVNYGSFATGGAGLVVVEATGVEARGRISPGCPGLWKDEQINPWKRVTSFLKSQGCVAGIQIAHAGRKASTVAPWVGRDSIDDKEGGWPTIGASAIEFGDKVWKVPKEATIEDIEGIKRSFVSASERAVRAGFEVF
ncbi:unnamed protein product, partial [Oppiella nova]